MYVHCTLYTVQYPIHLLAAWVLHVETRMKPETASLGGFFGFFVFMYIIQHCFICHPLESTVFGGCWDRTQDCRDFGIGTDSQTL
jgi:hypothetical protein